MRLTAYNLRLHYHKEPVRIRRATCERGKRTAATRPYETCVAIVFARYELVFIYIFFFFFFPLPFSIIRSDARKRRRRRRKNIARLYMARLLCARAPRKVTQKAQVVINTHKQMAWPVWRWTGISQKNTHFFHYYSRPRRHRRGAGGNRTDRDGWKSFDALCFIPFRTGRQTSTGLIWLAGVLSLSLCNGIVTRAGY